MNNKALLGNKYNSLYVQGKGKNTYMKGIMDDSKSISTFKFLIKYFKKYKYFENIIDVKIEKKMSTF